MNNKTTKFSVLATLIIVSILGIGVIIYRNYNSIENQSKRALQDNITAWYYPSKSIEYANPNRRKDQQGKEKAVDLFRTIYGLDNNWKFVDESYDLNYLKYSAVVVDTTYLFENKTDYSQQLFKERYYYDLDEPIPVPLTQNTTLIDRKEKFEEMDKSTLWNGDFDSWCVKSN
ncbi:MAG: hypothetical protein NTV24_04900 [Candidatus Woesebacteria bacterium]|nr:hypothetical protein [Candidatus Woesebacteria bacterium]